MTRFKVGRFYGVCVDSVDRRIVSAQCVEVKKRVVRFKVIVSTNGRRFFMTFSKWLGSCGDCQTAYDAGFGRISVPTRATDLCDKPSLWDDLEKKKSKEARKMKYGDKFKSADERATAFKEFCDSQFDCESCPLTDVCNEDKPTAQFMWLDREIQDTPPLQCPFCGARCVGNEVLCAVECTECSYVSSNYKTLTKAIAEHNRVVKAVIKDNEEGE